MVIEFVVITGSQSAAPVNSAVVVLGAVAWWVSLRAQFISTGDRQNRPHVIFRQWFTITAGMLGVRRRGICRPAKRRYARIEQSTEAKNNGRWQSRRFGSKQAGVTVYANVPGNVTVGGSAERHGTGVTEQHWRQC